MTLKQIKINKTDDTLYCETIDNGLQVYMVPKANVNTVFVSFNVKYGAIYNEFIPIGEKKMKHFPNGIAHFLEHKMFAQENGIDPMLFYGNNGADVNAYTSLYNTSYHFSCPSHLKENLEYLLNFVQAPYFTDENVEKEKGIIEEEIKMYNDDPYSFLEEHLRLNVFKDHPIRYSIAGTVEDVNSITKEDLYLCYNTFYHPSNMFLVITGNFDPSDVIEIIKNNQAEKKFKNIDQITTNKPKEKDKVVLPHEEVQMNVEVPKISYGIKLPLKKINMDPKKRDLYLAIMLDTLFGATSEFNEEMKQKGYLLSYVGIETTYTDTYLLITISADTEHVDELLVAIKKTLDNINISDDDFDRKIKMFVSSNIHIYEDVDSVNRNIVNDLILYGKFYDDIDTMLDSLKRSEWEMLKRNLDFKNTSVLIIKPMSK
jgi:predicted Zn-dependent peptidase